MVASARSDGMHGRCSRSGCVEQSRYRPVFLFVFSNGARRRDVRPDVTLCERHRADLARRFHSRAWQLQFDLNLPPSCATVDWARSRVLFEATTDSSATI